MLALLLFFVLFTQALAQDIGCDFRQYVQPNQRYIISSPRYPYSYLGNTTCRWIAECPTGYQCRLDCYLEMPLTSRCNGDQLLISRMGDSQLTGAETYCGRQTLTGILSVATSLSVGFRSVINSVGGRFMCNLTAQAAPKPPCRCGIRKVNRIVGGTEAGVNEFPMMAGLMERRQIIENQRILCGGVLISDRYVLSSAHCMYRQTPSSIVISIGDRNLYKGTMYNVTNFVNHPYYNSTNYDFDVTIILLSGRVPMTDNMSPVCLPFIYQNANLTGAVVTLLGWGTMFFGGPTSSVLLKTDVKIISQENCPVTDRQVCTLTPGKDACQNDSGGPGLYLDPRSGRYFVFLTVSFGDGCGMNSPGIHARITSPEILRWIVNTTRSDFCVVE